MVVERLHVQRTVDVGLAVVIDDVACRGAILQFGTATPVVSGGIVRIGIEPVEDRQLIERQLIGGGEVLPIVQRTTEVLDAAPHGILPCRIAVGIEVFVDGLVAVGLLNLSLRT